MKKKMVRKIISVVLCVAMLVVIGGSAFAAERNLNSDAVFTYIDANTFMYGDVLFVGDGDTLTLYQNGQMIERVTIQPGNEVILHEDFSNLGRGGRQEAIVQEFLVSDFISAPELTAIDSVIEYNSISPVSTIILPMVRYQVWYGTQPVNRALTFSTVQLSRTQLCPRCIVSAPGGTPWSVFLSMVGSFVGFALAGHILAIIGGGLIGNLPNPFALTFENGSARLYNTTGRDPATGRTFTRTGEVFTGTLRVNNNGHTVLHPNVTARAGWHPEFVNIRDIVLANSWFNLFWQADVFTVLW